MQNFDARTLLNCSCRAKNYFVFIDLVALPRAELISGFQPELVRSSANIRQQPKANSQPPLVFRIED